MTSVPVPRQPVTAEDVDRAVRALSDALAGVPDDAWDAVPEGSDWTCLWATGRGELPGHPRREDWRWFSEPVA